MALLERTHDLTLSGLSFGGEILAFGLMSPVAGYWADRLEQKSLMQAANLARTLVMAAILLTLLLGWPLWAYLLLSGLLGAAGAFFVPARSAFLRRIVSEEELPRVIAIEGTVSFLVRLVSPPLMGALLVYVPASAGIAVDLGAYALGMALLAPRWVQGDRVVVPHEGGDDWREGWRFITGHGELRALLGLDISQAVIGTAGFSLTVALLADQLHLPPQANGALLATTGLAGAIGTQVAGRLGVQRWTFVVLVLAIGLTYTLVPLATSLPMLAAMWALRGLAIGAYCVLVNQRLAAEVPAAVMGRVQAAWGLAACLSAAFGSAVTPFLLRTLGVQTSYSLFGLILGLVALVLAAKAAAIRSPRLVEAS